jgi:hypothetical protein
MRSSIEAQLSHRVSSQHTSTQSLVDHKCDQWMSFRWANNGPTLSQSSLNGPPTHCLARYYSSHHSTSNQISCADPADCLRDRHRLIRWGTISTLSPFWPSYHTQSLLAYYVALLNLMHLVVGYEKPTIRACNLIGVKIDMKCGESDEVDPNYVVWLKWGCLLCLKVIKAYKMLDPAGRRNLGILNIRIIPRLYEPLSVTTTPFVTESTAITWHNLVGR